MIKVSARKVTFKNCNKKIFKNSVEIMDLFLLFLPRVNSNDAFLSLRSFWGNYTEFHFWHFVKYFTIIRNKFNFKKISCWMTLGIHLNHSKQFYTCCTFSSYSWLFYVHFLKNTSLRRFLIICCSLKRKKKWVEEKNSLWWFLSNKRIILISFIYWNFFKIIFLELF